MNGVGANTTVKATQPQVITTVTMLAVVFGVLFVVSAVLWTLRGRKFKQTPEYQAYKTFRKTKRLPEEPQA
jgi:beta-glucosidase